VVYGTVYHLDDFDLWVGPITHDFGCTKNWNSSKSKEAAVGYCGFWKRLAIKFVDQILMIFIVPIFLNAYFIFEMDRRSLTKCLGQNSSIKIREKLRMLGDFSYDRWQRYFQYLLLESDFGRLVGAQKKTLGTIVCQTLATFPRDVRWGFGLFSQFSFRSCYCSSQYLSQYLLDYF